SLTPSAGECRIGAFGGSFIYDHEVSDHDSWVSNLERLNPHLEVLNFGVTSYGADQSFLRYQTEGAKYQPRVVMIGVTAIDIRSVVSSYSPFIFPNNEL